MTISTYLHMSQAIDFCFSWEPSEIFFNSYDADNAAFSEAILANFPECLMAECLVVNWFGSCHGSA